MKQGRRAQKLISPHSWTYVIWKKLEAKHQKYKGRVVLRPDIVKDDSGSYAVLNEQGSSASEMTAAKIMGIISRLPGCDWTSSRWSTCFDPGKNGRCSKITENSQIGMSRHLYSSNTTQMAKIMVQYGRPSRSSWTKFILSSFGRTVMGNAIWEILLKHGWEKIPNWECLFVLREKGLFLSVYVDDIKLAGEKQNLDPMWKELNKEVDLEEPTSSLDHENLGCSQRQCEISKDIVDNYRTMFESRISVGVTENLPCSENLRISSWSYDTEGHAKKCVEWYCELANKTTQQLYKVSTACIDDHQFWRRRIEIRGRIVKQMLSNCSEMLILGTYWKTRYSMVSEQTCTIDHKMDQSLWQTVISFDLLHPSHMWLQTTLSCGKHCQTMQIGTVSRLRFCRRSWGFKIYMNILHFWKSYVGSNQLDV